MIINKIKFVNIIIIISIKEKYIFMKRDFKEQYNNTVAKFCKKKMYLNTNISIIDNKRIEVENCKRIMEYNDIYVKLKTSTLILEVWGKDIVLSDYNMDGIVIEGDISSVEFN